MALMDCKECGGKMSDQADACPHCGWPNEVKKAIYTQKIYEENLRRAKALGMTYDEYEQYLIDKIVDEQYKPKGPFIHFGY